MVRLIITTLFLFSGILLLIAGCGGSSDDSGDTALSDATGIHIEDAWARPGSEGRMSAAYFIISNFDDETDILRSVASDVARNVEIHESYESEEGMMGMREIQNLEIEAGSTVRLEQGGLHVMLIQLTRQLQDGDTFELTLTFENHGEMTITVPARL
ncbi:copper chaperone PCu(A)C [Rhodohalobacter sp. SW132]|uniref:copper chaperone PCu(A)C n=1 Tax=Rhodohalobacter sp. SW132 TaxID=2293433 RepID=UPI000E27D4BA|nr:copper chaperone PCu(A)C [Rhodohalobacter sp. SW132]REL38908.1 copper chaperone PCu(A)C [Rhodohalobacter sp. SW132]